MEDNKKNILKKWWFWVCIAIFIIAIILIASLTKPKFKVDEFDIEKNIQKFEYIEDTVTYSGEGKITTKDKKGVYLVALKVILVEGGNEDKKYYDFLENGKKCSVTTVLVCNGKGSFSTYDSGEIGEIDRPDYDFDILGYVKLK